jgi:methylated-DNA-[protein]-cysteine S-methyltransferase
MPQLRESFRHDRRTTMKVDIFKTDWGWMGIAVTARGVAKTVLPRRSRAAVEREFASCHKSSFSNDDGNGSDLAAQHLKVARKAIRTYFAGSRNILDLPLDLDGQPLFRRRVWEVLRTIPYGRVRSYGWVARKIGTPLAARAVGGACGENPIPLIVPCHRVVGGDGSLGGFSSGLPTKKRLLRLEGVLGDKVPER